MAQGNARGGEISDVAYDAGTWDGVINEAASKNAIRDKFVTVDSAVSSNTSHAAGDGSDHSDVAANTAASHAELHNAASHSDQTATGAEVDAAHAHVSADGSSHSDVVDNTNAISALTSSYSRRKAVIDYIINNTLAPPSETDGNRFILAFDGGAPHANWDGASAGDIVEFVTDTWVATTPLEGYIAYVDDDDKDALCIDDGGASWELRNVNTLLHEDLTDVSSDQHHAESHNAASHSDIDSTGAQLDGAVTHAGTTTGNPHNLDSTDVGAEASGAVSTHAALTTGVHGAGGDTLATDADITTHAGDADAHHAESHTIASHDTTATGAELTELTDSSETTLHSHAASSGTMIYDKLIAPSGGDYTSVVTALSTEGKE